MKGPIVIHLSPFSVLYIDPSDNQLWFIFVNLWTFEGYFNCSIAQVVKSCKIVVVVVTRQRWLRHRHGADGFSVTRLWAHTTAAATWQQDKLLSATNREQWLSSYLHASSATQSSPEKPVSILPTFYSFCKSDLFSLYNLNTSYKVKMFFWLQLIGCLHCFYWINVSFYFKVLVQIINFNTWY